MLTILPASITPIITLDVLTVYFGAVDIKKIRYALAVGLLADLAGIMAAIFICNLVFKP